MMHAVARKIAGIGTEVDAGGKLEQTGCVRGEAQMLRTLLGEAIPGDEDTAIMPYRPQALVKRPVRVL